MVNMRKEHIEIIIGGIMLVVSFLISFLMVIGILEKSYVLSIAAFTSSFAGLLIGYHGIYGLIVTRRRKG
ncbi:MAG: hypothetical protein QW702_05735 [Candidatus Bathyarchaeia archaeon]